MALRIVESTEERLLSAPVMEAVRVGIERRGSALVLVPSFSRAVELQRALADVGVALGVAVTTPAAWVRDRWDAWGDGRTIADSIMLSVLAHEVLVAADRDGGSPLSLSPGLVSLLSSLVTGAAPWLPLGPDGTVDERACLSAGLTEAETALIGAVGELRSLLRACGRISASDASHEVPALLGREGVSVPDVVYVGWSQMRRADVELARGLAATSEVTFVARSRRGAASEEVAGLVRRLGGSLGVASPVAWKTRIARDEGLSELLDALFTGEQIDVRRPGPVELLLASGPVAEAELVARRAMSVGSGERDDGERDDAEYAIVTRATGEHAIVGHAIVGERGDGERGDGERDDVELTTVALMVATHMSAAHAKAGERGVGAGGSVVIAVPDTVRARRELFDKLAQRGATVRIKASRPLLECPTAAAFLSYAETVARLVELDATWPEPETGIDGAVPRLGSMDWWPPRTLVDLLLTEASGVDPAKAWALDARWRGNRLLTPAQVLASLRSARDTSPALARATEELLRGHVGTAASRLLAPLMFVGRTPREKAVPSGMAADATLDPGAEMVQSEAVASLQGIMRIAVAVREVGRSLGDSVALPSDLGGIIRLCRWAAEGVSVRVREEVVGAPDAPRIDLVSAGEAAELPPGSVDTLIVCGLTTAESPIGRVDDLEGALLEQLGVEPPAEPMARARASFHALVSLPTRHLVLERALHDADAKPAYPSVMLSELLTTYGMSPLAAPRQLPLPVATAVETDLAANLVRSAPTPPETMDPPAPEGSLTESARDLVIVPQTGSLELEDGRPILSASQVETYLDCPYKWFSLRRLRLGTVDAGHGGAEMGTFAHRVLEVTHRELLARALEAAAPGIAREELLAEIERDPARPVRGSRVTAETLETALAILEGELELHGQHLRMVRNPRPAQQVLVPHSLAEEVQEERLRSDLRSVMPYQAGLFAGFEPRLFEWGFGRRGELVEYAGAYFTGTVDRIDVSPSGDAVIIDYKHKSPSGFAAEYDAIQEGVLEGEAIPRRVQSLIYAQVVRRAFAGRLRLVGTVYLATKSPHALAGAADAAFAGRVFGSLSSRRLPHVSVPATEGGELGMYGLLDRTEELVAEQVAGMLAGDVEARPRDKESCQFCPVMHCERRVAR